MKLIPYGSRMVVQFKKSEPKKGSLILPNEEQPQFATVIDAGECPFDEGDLVALAKYAGVPVKMENEMFLVVEEKDVIAYLEKNHET